MEIFFYIFLIFAQNIDCGYTLEPPRPPNHYFAEVVTLTSKFYFDIVVSAIYVLIFLFVVCAGSKDFWLP